MFVLPINVTMYHRGVYCWHIDVVSIDNITKFYKIAIQNYKFQMASGQESHRIVESRKIIYHLGIARSYQIFVNNK